MLLFCVRDSTNLVVHAEAFEQAIPMDGTVPTYASRPAYCEAIRLQVARAKTANLPDENVYTENHISNSYNGVLYEGMVWCRLRKN